MSYFLILKKTGTLRFFYVNASERFCINSSIPTQRNIKPYIFLWIPITNVIFISVNLPNISWNKHLVFILEVSEPKNCFYFTFGFDRSRAAIFVLIFLDCFLVKHGTITYHLRNLSNDFIYYKRNDRNTT